MYPETSRALASAPIFASHVEDVDEPATKRFDARTSELARRVALPIQGRDIELGLTSELDVASRLSLPDDLKRILSRDEWKDAVSSALDSSSRRKDFRDNVRVVARWLANLENVDTHSSAPGIDELVLLTRLHRCSVYRCLNWLQGHGFLLRLSTGRSAGLPGTNGLAYRARYLLTLPSTDKDCDFTPGDRHLRRLALQTIDLATQVTATPSWSSWSSLEKKPPYPPQTQGLYSTKKASTSTAAPRRHRATRRVRLYDIAHELKTNPGFIREFPNLAERDIARVIKPFVDAGWTTNDLNLALEWLPGPNGTRHPHSGTKGVHHPKGWIRYRLHFWTTNGVPDESNRQRHLREHEERMAAQRKAEAERERERADDVPTPSEILEILRRAGVRIRPTQKGRLMNGGAGQPSPACRSPRLSSLHNCGPWCCRPTRRGHRRARPPRSTIRHRP